ncbi:MAG: hypothetical protein ACAH88_04295 [Roseimicrobium sp.]
MLRALDRFVRRLPSLIKLMVATFIAIMATGAFLAKVLDRFGVRGCPPNTEPITWHYWLVLAGGLWMFWRVVRDILWPRLKIEEWTPVHQGDGVILAQTRAKMRYAYLTTHPSYILVDVLSVIGPAILMVMAWNEPCHANHQVLMLRSAVALWIPIPLLRMLSWYGLARGRAALFQHLPEDAEETKKAALEWRICWQPVLNLWALYIGIGALILGIISWERRQEEKNTAVFDAALRATATSDPGSLGDKRIRVIGKLAGEVREFRGQLRGAGAAFETDAGLVFVFSDALMRDEFTALLKNAGGGEVRLVATVMPEISREDRENFGWGMESFASPTATITPVLLRLVKP